MASSWEELKKRKQGEKKAADVQGRSLPEKTHYTWEELKAKKNGNVSVAEADAEAASSSGNGSVRYTWEQLKAKKAGLPLVPTEAQKSVKRGTYASAVTTPYSEAAAAAYRKFKGEDAPASSLNVGVGTPAAKKVAGSFVGPLQQKYIREETQEKQRTPLKPLEEYAAQKSKRIGAGEAARTDYTTVVDDPEYSKYRWIGEGMVDNPVAKANADADYTRLNAMTSNNPAVQETAGYTYMTKEQQDIYNYLFGNTEQYGKEAAQDYYDRFVRDSVNAQQGEGLAQGIKELPTWFKPVGYGMASVATGADGAMEGYKGLSDFVAGNEDARAKSATQYAGERLTQDMNLPGRIAWDVGSAVGQQLPQMTVGFLTGGLGTALRAGATSLTQAASILGRRYNEELRSGASVEEARKAAIASAAIETATEMVGGVEMLSGFTLSGKKIDKLVDGISSAVGKIAVRTGFDMLGEGFEEGVSGVLEPLVRQYILGQGEAEINVEEVAYQALIGALSGGVLGAPVNTANAIAENREKAARAAAQSVKSEEATPEQKHNAAKKALEIADVEKADELADAVVKMANGEELTQDEMQAVATTEGALEVVKEIAGTEVNQKAAEDTNEAAEEVSEEYNADWEEAPEELEGAEQDAWYNRQRAVSAAAKLGGERRIHEEIYDMGGGQQDAEAYADEFERAYNRGANNLKLTDKITASYTTLNPDQAQAAWNEGRKAYETTIAKAPARSKVSMNGNVGSVDATALKGLKLNTNQRAAIRASQTIAEALGIKVVWEASEANEQGKRESMNGWYLPKDQSIHLDIYAGSVDATQSAAFQYATMRTFSHELTHFIQDQSPAQYAQLRDMVFGYLQEQGMDVEALIEEKAKNYSRVNGYTRFDVTQEVIADACEMMLRDSTAVETAMKKDPSLWERIKEKFAEFVEDLRAAFGRVDKLHPEARALMREAEGVLKYAEDLQKKWDEALLSTMEEQKNPVEEQRNTERYAPRNYDVVISQNEIDSNIKLVKKMEPVVMLKGDEAILHDGNLKESVLDFYQKNGNVATNRVLGDVQLTKSSYKSDMGHGMTPLKALTFWAVPGTIEKGEIISYSENWKDRGYRTYVIAAPITIEQGERRGDYWSGVVVKADANMQNVYAHDALMIKKEGPAALQNGAAANAGDTVGYRSSIHKILQQLNEVKREEQKEATGTKREGVALMEDRSGESIKDRSMRPFAEEVPEVREWFAMAAELLRDDLAASTPGQKMYIPVQGNEPGTVNVTGQKRSTVDEIADLLDHGMTYRNISDALDAYAQIDMGWIGKHPQTAKKVELSLDQVLMHGYTNIEGERVPGVEDYKALMDELAGREAKEPVEYDLGEDMVFSRRDTSLDLSDMRRYSLREPANDNTSYQGKGLYRRAIGTNRTVDMMSEKIGALPEKLRNDNPMALAVIEQAAGDPEAQITIYRATPGNSINDGDWVYLDEEHAQRWTKTHFGRPKPGVQVVSKTVKAKEVDWTGKNLDFVYRPETDESVRYSLREPVADSAAFQKWFGESKVVNADGTPMVVYHGTDAYDQINVFKRGKKGWLGPGIYLAQNRNDAQHYADKSGYGGRVYELYARVENPLVVTQSNPVPEILQAAYNRSSIYEKRSAKQANDVSILTPADIKKLQEKGYDGIIWKFGKGPWEINVFSPEQLKSATDNTGAYSRESKDIRYQERDETYVSNRELLANALEGAAQTVAERNKIAEYKRRVRSLDIAENRAAFVREEMAEISKDLKDKNLRDSEKAELNERLTTLREQRERLDREINEADKVLLKLEATEPLQKVVNRERKAAMDRVRAKANERRDIDKYKQKIANKVASLTVLLTRPSTKKYLPDPIRGPVAEFLSSISFVSKRQLQGGKPTQKDMKFAESLAALQRVMSKVRERYNDAETSEVVQEGFGGYLDLPEGFVKSLTTLSEKVEQDAKHSEEGYNVNMMSIAQLESLDEIITTLKKSIENVNKFLGENLYKHVDQAARDTFVDLGDMKNRTRTTDAGEFFEWENAMPAYAFDRFGRGGKAVFNGLVHGQGKLGMNAKQVIDFANDTYTAEEARKWAEDIKTFRFGDDELKIPVTHIMSLYCLRKREQAQGHLQGEGIRVEDFEYKGRRYKDPGRTVDDRMLDEIVSVLSDRQKAVADKLQAYMVEVGSEWGNEVSMRRFGYRAFEEKNYFPINSDGNHLAAVSEEGGKGNAMYALLNISPTKELTPKANNRLMLYNIFDVFANHMSDMAQYNAMALPLLDAIKWINYKESTKLPGSDARHTRSMQDAIDMAYGKTARRYVIRMLEDVSGRKATVSEDKMTGKMLGRVNRAAVAANLRVALLQPLSLIRAGMDMNAVPIVMGFARNPVHLRENIEKMQKYSGIAVWKDLGFRELNISRGLKKLIKHDETVMENIVDKSMIMAEAADKFTWAAMWEAAEIQTAKMMSRSDEGFYTAVRDLFERTVYRTQVVDSVLTKSQYMRTPAGMNKLFSSFMSEPVTTYNMLADMVWKISDESRRLAAKDIAENGQPKNKAEAAQRAAKYVGGATKVNAKLVGRTFAVYGASVVATTLLEAVMTAWRDDDDYETFMDKLKETTIWDWIDNMNPLAMVPVGSQLWDLFKMALNKLGSDAYGFEMTLPMTDIFNTATELYDMWNKWSQGKGSATGYGVAYKGAQLVSDVVGLPFASFAREGISLWNNAVASFVPELRVTTYATPDVKGASAYLRAVRENDDRLAAEMMAELEANNVTGGALLDAMEDAIKAAYKSGGMDKDEAARLLEKYAGYENEKDDKYAAERLVREWEVKGESGENSQYAWVWNHISDWDGKALKEEIKELKALGVKESSIRTSVTNHFKDEYLQATGREKTDLKAHLITALTMLGMSSAEAKKKIESWKEE